jgi:hypothetical protein
MVGSWTCTQTLEKIVTDDPTAFWPLTGVKVFSKTFSWSVVVGKIRENVGQVSFIQLVCYLQIELGYC